MRITSMVGRFSGVVTYDDNSKGSFHTQWDDKAGVFSANQAESQENMRQLSWDAPGGLITWPYWSYIGLSINALPFMNFNWDTNYPAIQKVVTGMVARLDFLFARDDNKTYPVAIVGELRGVVPTPVFNIRIETPDLASDADNLATIKTQIQEMFRKIMDTATVS